MWFWVVIVVLGLAIGGLAVARTPGNRLRGGLMFGTAAGVALLIEVLIRFDAISVDQGTDLMALAVLVLIAAALALMPRPGHSDRS